MESVDLICAKLLNKQSKPEKPEGGMMQCHFTPPTSDLNKQATTYHVNLSIGASLKNWFHPSNKKQMTQTPVLDQITKNRRTSTTSASSCQYDGTDSDLYNHDRDFNEF